MGMRNDLLIERPEAAAIRQLLLLFHGVGSSAEDLRPLGEALAAQRPQACVERSRSDGRVSPGLSVPSTISCSICEVMVSERRCRLGCATALKGTAFCIDQRRFEPS